MSRLTPGIPKVPDKVNYPSLATVSPNTDLVLTSLRSHQSVIILKCGSNPKARVLHLSRLILNDACERNAKIKVVAALRAGRQPRDYAESITNDRNENLTATIGKITVRKFEKKLPTQFFDKKVRQSNDFLTNFGKAQCGNDTILLPPFCHENSVKLTFY